MKMVWLVTGGAGFIGGNFVLEAVAAGVCVINLDALTYAGNRDTLASLRDNPGLQRVLDGSYRLQRIGAAA